MSEASATEDGISLLASALAERDQYKKLYMDLLERVRKLELGIMGQQRERFISNDQQLSLALLGEMFEKLKEAEQAQAESNIEAHVRKKPTGRKPLPEILPRVDIEILPPEVEAKGKDAFDKIGEDVSETIERRPASVVVVRTHRPKFVAKDQVATPTDTSVLQGETHDLPIPKGLAGPAFLADSIVRRWQDHLPLHRLERIYGREHLDLSRSTICGWHMELKNLVTPLIDAMWEDAFHSPYLCTDATGVLVQALEKCRNAHFFVVAAPEKHVLFGYSQKHDGEAVDRLLAGYQGYLVADAHAVYDHLYASKQVIEVGCWAHARRYFFKALDSEPALASQALAMIQALFKIERAQASVSPEHRKKVRTSDSKPIAKKFFDWCDAHAPHVLDHTPIQKAIGYARNQAEALQRFLEDGRLPLHNNFSERALRREALGRNNWIFLGSDEGGETNAAFTSLLASAQLHDLEPCGYLRDLFCLLPQWPQKRVLELAPAYWRVTAARDEVQRLLNANVFRQISLGVHLAQRQPE